MGIFLSGNNSSGNSVSLLLPSNATSSQQVNKMVTRFTWVSQGEPRPPVVGMAEPRFVFGDIALR